MDTITDIARFLLTLAAVALVLAPLVLLARMEHVARRRGSSAGDRDDADARRVAAELRAIDTATAPVPELRGRRHAWVSRAR